MSEQHLEELIDGLLTLTRGQVGLERRAPLDLAALATRLLLASDSRLAGQSRPSHDVANAAGHRRSAIARAACGQLVDNAIRHNMPGGRVEIITSTRDRHAFVSVTNTGPAVPPEDIQRLLQPFQRLGRARTRHNDGHDLGLSIVQAIVDVHGAALRVTAPPEGGLAVDVSFPPVSGSRRRVLFAPARIRRVA